MTQPMEITNAALVATAADAIAEAVAAGTLPDPGEVIFYRHRLSATELLTIADRYDTPVRIFDNNNDHRFGSIHIPLYSDGKLTVEYRLYSNGSTEKDMADFRHHNDECVSDPKPPIPAFEEPRPAHRELKPSVLDGSK